jgi:hypothetical protein
MITLKGIYPLYTMLNSGLHPHNHSHRHKAAMNFDCAFCELIHIVRIVDIHSLISLIFIVLRVGQYHQF